MMSRMRMAAMILAIAWLHAPLARGEELYVGFWNIENLFDLENDPNVQGDEEFTPEGAKRWTKERLDIKLNNLASIISKMNDNRGPDVLGLCEVENRWAVEMLVEKLAPLGRSYEIVHQDSPSDRGIDCALIFDSNVFKLADSKFHYVEAEKTRDIVEARLQRNDGDLYVFVNHWPSRNNDEWQRIAAAKVLRARLDEILADDPDADIIMIGDFNDETDNVSIKDNLRARGSMDKLPAGAMFDTSAAIKAAGKGTHFYDNRWEVLDHIIISPGLLDDARFRWKTGSTTRLEFPELFYHPPYKDAAPRPSTSYTRSRFHKNGYSDHLAVGCVIEKK
jgi:endonuclease/exonuclease/phosphatase family metal-dependent hydrolase